jgi:hypothetical protein
LINLDFVLSNSKSLVTHVFHKAGQRKNTKALYIDGTQNKKPQKQLGYLQRNVQSEPAGGIKTENNVKLKLVQFGKEQCRIIQKMY